MGPQPCASERPKYGGDQVPVAKLNWRKIDGDPNMRRPTSGLGTCLSKDPLTDGDNKSRLLSQTNKLIGRDATAGGMIPPQQRLKATDLLFPQVYLRLIEQLKLTGQERPAKIHLQPAARLHFCVHRRFE